MIDTMIDWKIGKYLYPVRMVAVNERFFFKFGFNRAIMDEVKAMQGAQWHGFDDAPHQALIKSLFNTNKVWSVKDCPGNRFRMEYVQGGNPYEPYDNIDFDIDYPEELRDHQREWYAHGLSVHYGIWAGEMGTGKTLPAIRLMEASGFENWWYIAPKSAGAAVREELVKWDAKIKPRIMTYEGLVKAVETDFLPAGVIFDESQKIKTPSSLRSKAARKLADGIREKHGFEGFAIAMTGTPAPRSPIDWWNQCETIRPGFLREGNLSSFKMRLGIYEKEESSAGFSYNAHVAWLDDPEKCSVCGTLKGMHMDKGHDWQRSENEIDKLYERLKGLVVVKWKRDCLDLPEKQYRVIACKPRPSTIRAAQLITANSTRAVTALTHLRELSDGFQYREVECEDSESKCDICEGSGSMTDFELKPEYDNDLGIPEMSEEDFCLSEAEYNKKFFNEVKVECTACKGSGTKPRIKRIVERVHCPKDDALVDLLAEHKDIGRIVIYAGFEASVNHCVDLCQQNSWAVVKWDGKGIRVWDERGHALPTGKDGVNPVKMFQEHLLEHPRVAFVGNSDAAGTGLTLTASPTIVYYSNTFKSDARIQSEDRIHRMGMDVNRGATIIDLIHLPTDKYVLDNLKQKRDLQNRTMGDLTRLLDTKIL